MRYVDWSLLPHMKIRCGTQSAMDDQKDINQAQEALAAPACNYESMPMFIRLKANLLKYNTYWWYDNREWPGAGCLILWKMELLSVSFNACSIHFHIMIIAMQFVRQTQAPRSYLQVLHHWNRFILTTSWIELCSHLQTCWDVTVSLEREVQQAEGHYWCGGARLQMHESICTNSYIFVSYYVELSIAVTQCRLRS